MRNEESAKCGDPYVEQRMRNLEKKQVLKHCYDVLMNVTSKGLPWCEVRQAREQELTYVRDPVVYDEVDEREAIAQYHGSTQTKKVQE